MPVHWVQPCAIRQPALQRPGAAAAPPALPAAAPEAPLAAAFCALRPSARTFCLTSQHITEAVATRPCRIRHELLQAASRQHASRPQKEGAAVTSSVPRSLSAPMQAPSMCAAAAPCAGRKPPPPSSAAEPRICIAVATCSARARAGTSVADLQGRCQALRGVVGTSTPCHKCWYAQGPPFAAS